MINKNVIDAIVAGYKDEQEPRTLSSYIFDKLKSVEETKNKLYYLRDDINKINKEAEEKIKLVKQSIAEIQKKCQHWSKTYHSSGNNDYFFECDICGIEL